MEAMTIETKPTIVHCHGCFDVLHLGHILHLQEARALGDFLVVTVTADEFISKGPGRPIFTASQRVVQLAALNCVDFVTICHAPNAADAIRVIKPHLFVKGQDVANFNSAGFEAEKAALAEVGGKLVFTTGEIHHSTEIAGKVLATV